MQRTIPRDRSASSLSRIAAERRHQRTLLYIQKRKQDEQEQLDRVVAEFGGDPNAMAQEILRYRHAEAQLASAIAWVQKGAPFAIIGPGKYWRPRQAQETGT
jgi:hypothetical protein